jgi:hypothetical protein
MGFFTTPTTYYSPLNCPIAASFWHAATNTPSDTWKHTAWKAAKFMLLFLPALVATVLDLTVFNFFRCTIGNLYLYFTEKKVEPLSNLQICLLAGVGITAFVAALWLVPKLERGIASILPRTVNPGEISLPEGAKPAPLGSVEIISGWGGALVSKAYSWVDILGIPSFPLSLVQKGWQHLVSPSLTSLDKMSYGWLSTLVLKAPWNAYMALFSVKYVYDNMPPELQAKFPRFSGYYQTLSHYLNYPIRISFWNFLCSPFLMAPSPISGVYAGVQNIVRQPLAMVGLVFRLGSLLGVTGGAVIATEYLIEKRKNIAKFFTPEA